MIVVWRERKRGKSLWGEVVRILRDLKGGRWSCVESGSVDESGESGISGAFLRALIFCVFPLVSTSTGHRVKYFECRSIFTRRMQEIVIKARGKSLSWWF